MTVWRPTDGRRGRGAGRPKFRFSFYHALRIKCTAHTGIYNVPVYFCADFVAPYSRRPISQSIDLASVAKVKEQTTTSWITMKGTVKM